MLVVFIEILDEKKPLNRWLFLKKYNYPYGKTTLKPSPKIDRDIKILELSKKKGSVANTNPGIDDDYKYTDMSIETEIWEDEFPSLEESKKYRNIIKKARQRRK